LCSLISPKRARSAQYAVTYGAERPNDAGTNKTVPFEAVEETSVFPSRFPSLQTSFWDPREVEWHKHRRVRRQPAHQRRRGGAIVQARLFGKVLCLPLRQRRVYDGADFIEQYAARKGCTMSATMASFRQRPHTLCLLGVALTLISVCLSACAHQAGYPSQAPTATPTATIEGAPTGGWARASEQFKAEQNAMFARERAAHQAILNGTALPLLAANVGDILPGVIREPGSSGGTLRATGTYIGSFTYYALGHDGLYDPVRVYGITLQTPDRLFKTILLDPSSGDPNRNDVTSFLSYSNGDPACGCSGNVNTIPVITEHPTLGQFTEQMQIVAPDQAISFEYSVGVYGDLDIAQYLYYNTVPKGNHVPVGIVNSVSDISFDIALKFPSNPPIVPFNVILF